MTAGDTAGSASESAYARELEVARAAAREAAAIIRRHYEHGTETWEKSEDNPLTLADLEADRCIERHLEMAFPSDAILSEEKRDSPERLGNDRVWIVDPMDGTHEFVRRVPEFAVSIALCEGGEPVVAVVHNPPADVAVWASRGSGTYRDGERMHISSVRELSEAVLIASRTETERNMLDAYEGWFKEIRPVGSIAWKLACVACGDGDLNWSRKPKNEWDVCAGDLLIREAGGHYLSLMGGQARSYNQVSPLLDCEMAAGPRALLDALFARHDAERRAPQ